MKKILITIGTRPEAIKLAPVIQEFRSHSHYQVIVASTGQHKELVRDTLNSFNIKVDYDLDIMKVNQKLEDLTASLFSKASEMIEKIQPDMVFGQGDTTTVFVMATVCFYKKIPFAHVEAGLRSQDILSPFPEEFNRRVASLVSKFHFAPSKDSANNLIKEGISTESIYIVGNTVIDALKAMRSFNKSFSKKLPSEKKIVLVTAHRRENFGKPHENVFESINFLSKKYPELYFVYPVHPNPNVKNRAQALLSSNTSVLLTDPLDYSELVALLRDSFIVMTDSGGIQEEAPFLGKPVVVLRKETERPEIISEGMGVLVGTDSSEIIETVSKLVEDKEYYNSFVKNRSPYGDGEASIKIREIIDRYFQS